MGKSTGFMEYPRRKTPWRDAVDRALDYYEIYTPAREEQLKKQGARCMNCGVPFCESEHGCPIDNLIPEWNDLVYKGKWKEAYERLTKTNNCSQKGDKEPYIKTSRNLSKPNRRLMHEKQRLLEKFL